MIREIYEDDLEGLLNLYTHLHNNPIPEFTMKLKELWNEIAKDKNHHIIVAEEDGKLVSTCVCVIISNLTHNQRPYAVVENVVTEEAYRKKGLATACLQYARKLAQEQNCYKMMLLTSSMEESTLNFYEQAGYNRNEKTAFIQWI